jgi:Spy/CpxP family protein refolding chaperone
MTRDMVRRFSDRLDLTREQQDRLFVILEKQRHEMEGLMQRFHPPVQSLLESLRTQIRTLLTPEQQKEFDHMITEEKARIKRFEEHRQPPLHEQQGGEMQ